MNTSPESITIDSHIKPPVRNKMKRAAAEKNRKIFKAYADAYQALYVRRPDSFTITENGCMQVMFGDRASGPCQLPKRIVEMTKMMRNRINDRE